MERGELKHRLEVSTVKLIEFTQQFVTNALARNTEFIVVPNRMEVSDHLNEIELHQLETLIKAQGKGFTLEEVSSLIHVSDLAPLWVNIEVHRASKTVNTVKLICSRRLRDINAENCSNDALSPFHPKVPLPPWHKEGVKFNVNWKHQILKRKWYALTWNWRRST